MRASGAGIKTSILILLSSVLLLSGCGKRIKEGLLIVTVLKSESLAPDFVTGDNWRYTPGSRLILINPEKPGKAEELTPGFFSARSAEVSFDGRHMLFMAQRAENDPWQVWEMDLTNMKHRQITDSEENIVDPAYLPGGQMTFSLLHKNDTLKAGHSLYTADLQGERVGRITFNPHTYFGTSVLRDGRILVISRQVFPSASRPVFMVMRPDGTKSELFYKSEIGAMPVSRPWETNDGKIVFVESDTTGEGTGEIVAVRYNRPLHSAMILTDDLQDDFTSVFPLANGNLLVTLRSKDNSEALCEFDPDKREIVNEFYSNTEEKLLEAVEVTVREVPRKLPSEVDFGVKTGIFLCQNINVTGMNSPETAFSLPLAEKIEVIGVDSSLGIVDVEKDGSVYIKIIADMPFRIKTLDRKGNVVNGPGGWYWLRPNERRGCVGCHEDNEIVPANRYAVAVSKDPVSIPVQITGIKEKEVELE